MKLNTWLNVWLNKYAKHLIKLRTYIRYQYMIEKHINPILGEYELEDLSAQVLQDFMLSKLNFGNLKTGKELANNTVIGIINLLKQALTQAQALGYVEKEYSKMIKLPPATEKKVTAFEKPEQEKLEKYCINHKKKNYIGIVICLYSGIRLGELLALTWNDIDFDKNYINIAKTVYNIKQDGVNVMVVDTPKTKNSNRVIPLPKQLVDILKKIKKTSTSPYIITTYKNGVVGTRAYQRTYEKILQRLEIPYKNFHCLRHTFATRAVEMGMDIKTLSEILGHKNPMITLQRYTHSLMSYKTEMMNKLGKTLSMNISS